MTHKKIWRVLYVRGGKTYSAGTYDEEVSAVGHLRLMREDRWDSWIVEDHTLTTDHKYA